MNMYFYTKTGNSIFMFHFNPNFSPIPLKICNNVCQSCACNTMQCNTIPHVQNNHIINF